jgi:hypothetical protein
MGSLSADKAAVGSAVNDTTRQLGGTLGVAIVDSVFASVYSGRLGTDSALAALSADVRSAMEKSMAAAERLIGQLPAGRTHPRPRCGQPCVPGWSAGRVTGLRRNRAGRSGHCRRADAGAGGNT